MQKVLENIWVDSLLLNDVKEFISEWNSDSEVVLARTSGSTGIPKNISLLKNGMCFSARNTIAYFELNEKTKALLCLPLTSIGGKMMLVRALESRMTMFVDVASSNPLSKRDESFDFIAVTPMQLANMLDESMSKLKKIKSILVGGAPMNENLIYRLHNEKITVYHGYGMTETASHVAIKKVGFEADDYYYAMPGISFEYGQNQTLRINYPALQSDLIETTDVVELIDSKRFKWVGRNDFVVNSGGIKIHIEEIENQLSKLIEFPFFVFGISDVTLGEKLILCIESSEKINTMNFNFLGIKKPREIYILTSFVYTESGKIDRHATVNQLKLNE